MAVTQKQKQQIKEEAGFRCAVPNCNITSPLEVHHIIHQANGGTNDNTNLICLCAGCHGRHHLGEIPAQSIQNYKIRARRIYLAFAQHEYNFLAALAQGFPVELTPETRNIGSRLEQENFVTVTELETGNFQLHITDAGREFLA